jgi:hypothetical protein
MQLSSCTTDADGRAELLAIAPTPACPVVLAVRRGKESRWLPFAPAADDSVRVVVPD